MKNTAVFTFNKYMQCCLISIIECVCISTDRNQRDGILSPYIHLCYFALPIPEYISPVFPFYRYELLSIACWIIYLFCESSMIAPLLLTHWPQSPLHNAPQCMQLTLYTQPYSLPNRVM